MPNRNYKDSIFVDLFSKDIDYKENFISLYNALTDSALAPATTKLESVKLEKVLYMSFVNDVSMLVDNKIVVLIEHQSTINPNMPIRFLEYVTRIYEKLLTNENKYSKKQIYYPLPEFYVLYNGETDFPKEKILRFSDGYIDQKFNKTKNKNYNFPLEIFVKVININSIKASKILSKCNILNDYEYFIEKVRIKKKENPDLELEDVILLVIEECKKENRFTSYLERKSKEVINMFYGEYDYATDIKVQRKEAFDDGIAVGIKQGERRGITRGRSEGIALGEKRGIQHTALNFLNSGFDIIDISKNTGLSVEEIEKLRDTKL